MTFMVETKYWKRRCLKKLAISQHAGFAPSLRDNAELLNDLIHGHTWFHPENSHGNF